MKIKIHLDQKRYSSKPQQRDIIEINKSITNKITECEIRDFIDMVGNNGQTFMPGLMNGARKKENFVGQQVYGLDFDEGITFEEFMERAEELELYPAFVYKTFSYTEEHPKFRAVYINDCIFEEWKGANILLKMLRYIYPESDKACVDASRIFFGGKANLYVNEDASINVRDVAVCLQAYIFKNKKSNCSKVIKKIGENLGIKVERGILRILAECSEDTRNGSRPVYILGLNQNSSIIYYIEENEKSYTQHAPGEYTRRIIQHKTIQDIMECYHYMSVCNADAWYIAVLIYGREFKYYKIERDDKIIQNLIQLEEHFWKNHVLARRMPDPDGSKLADSVIAECYPDAVGKSIPLTGFDDKIQRREEVESLLDKLETEKRQIDQELKLYLGEAETAENEHFRVSWKKMVSNRIDTKKLKEEKPEIYKAYLKECKGRRFTVCAA